MNNDKTKNDNNDNDSEKVFTIVELLIDAASGGETDLYKIGVKGLLALITDVYIQQLERFKNYLERRLEEYEEIDIYFKHIGDNFYVKNYIGFKNADDINKFDYNILNKKFPSFSTGLLAIILLVEILFLLLYK